MGGRVGAHGCWDSGLGGGSKIYMRVFKDVSAGCSMRSTQSVIATCFCCFPRLVLMRSHSHSHSWPCSMCGIHPLADACKPALQLTSWPSHQWPPPCAHPPTRLSARGCAPHAGPTPGVVRSRGERLLLFCCCSLCLLCDLLVFLLTTRHS